MDWFQFLSETLKNLAWPVVTLIIFFALRGPLYALMPFLEELKYKDFVLKFRAGLSEVRTNTTSSIASSFNEKTLINTPTDDTIASLYRVAKIAPTAAIIQAWATLEESLLNRLLGENKIKSDRFIGNSRLGHALLDEGVFSSLDFNTFHKLRQLRNIAAHKADTGLTENDALEYIDLTLAMIAKAKV